MLATKPPLPFNKVDGHPTCETTSDTSDTGSRSTSLVFDINRAISYLLTRLKVTLLVDTSANAILALHVTTTRKHDTKVAPALIKRNTDDVAILPGDGGYAEQKIRVLAREKVMRPLINHRKFSPLHKPWNARLDADLYGQRSQNETANSSLERKDGAFVRLRYW